MSRTPLAPGDLEDASAHREGGAEAAVTLRPTQPRPSVHARETCPYEGTFCSNARTGELVQAACCVCRPVLLGCHFVRLSSTF